MTLEQIEELIVLATDISLDGDAVRGSPKARFRELSTQYLKALAQQVGLAKEDYAVSFNPAGNALAGDARLESTRLYVMISVSPHGVMYRQCQRVPGKGKNKPRYESSRFTNHWFTAQELLNIDGVAAKLRAIEPCTPAPATVQIGQQ